jgi:1-deoxy-D-xylulose-5-phosphate reductoisomerase
MNMGGNVACAMNAANEIVVKAFLDNKIAFLRMPDIIERTIAKVAFVKNPSVDDYIASDTEARNIAHALCKQLT